MKALWWLSALLLTAGGPRQESMTQATVPEAPAGVEDPALAGGDTTVFDASHNAFGRALGNLAPSRWYAMREGKLLFMRDWAEHDARLPGALTNATHCGACHFKDGRGRPPPDVGDEAPLLVRLSVPSPDAPGGRPEPVYGVQLNDRGAAGVPPEGTVQVTYEEVRGTYADGTPYTLRKPRYRIANLGYGRLAPKTMLSPRIPSPVFGLGLLEAIPDAAIEALADAEDRDGDGISGRPNRVVSVRDGKVRLGRYGWTSVDGQV